MYIVLAVLNFLTNFLFPPLASSYSTYKSKGKFQHDIHSKASNGAWIGFFIGVVIVGAFIAAATYLSMPFLLVLKSFLLGANLFTIGVPVFFGVTWLLSCIGRGSGCAYGMHHTLDSQPPSKVFLTALVYSFTGDTFFDNFYQNFAGQTPIHVNIADRVAEHVKKNGDKPAEIISGLDRQLGQVHIDALNRMAESGLFAKGSEREENFVVLLKAGKNATQVASALIALHEKGWLNASGRDAALELGEYAEHLPNACDGPLKEQMVAVAMSMRITLRHSKPGDLRRKAEEIEPRLKPETSVSATPSASSSVLTQSNSFSNISSRLDETPSAVRLETDRVEAGPEVVPSTRVANSSLQKDVMKKEPGGAQPVCVDNGVGGVWGPRKNKGQTSD